MAEKVITLDTAIPTGGLDGVVTSYQHVLIDRAVIMHDKRTMSWRVKYGNVVAGEFVQGSHQPKEWPAQGSVSNRAARGEEPEVTAYTDLITVSGTGSWAIQMRDAVYDYMIANEAKFVGSIKETVV